MGDAERMPVSMNQTRNGLATAGKAWRRGLRFAILLTAAFGCLAAFGADDPAKKDDTRWIEVKPADVEGIGWRDGMEMPFDRVPKRFEKDLPSVWRNGFSSTGMFFEFESDTANVSVRTAFAQGRYGEDNFNNTAFAGTDLYVFDEARGAWRWVSATRHFVKWGPETEYALLNGLPPGRRRFRLYLPLRNRLKALWIGVDGGSQTAFRPPRRDKPVVYYGTSIIHGAFTIRPGLALTSRLERMLEKPIVNLGFSGAARLEPKAAEMLAEIDAAIYVCDPYHNLSPDLIRKNFEPFFDTLCARRPETPVMLVGAPPLLNVWLFPEKRKVDDEKTRLFEELSKRVAARHPNFRYVPGGQFYGSEEVSMDGVHPNDEAFSNMAKTLAPLIRSALKP